MPAPTPPAVRSLEEGRHGGYTAIELDKMTLSTTKATMTWRWILIISELLVVGYMTVVFMAGRAARHPSGAFVALGIAAFVAWAFLFLGSPFLVRSQRWLAILGWCTAVAAILSSGSP